MTAPPFVLSPEDAPWARSVNTRLSDLEREMERTKVEASAMGKGLEASLAGIQRTILAMGIGAASSAVASPVSATAATFTTIVSTVLEVPRGRTRGIFSLSGSLALLDTVTGGTAVAPQARFLIQGSPRPLSGTVGIPAAKDSGASRVNNVITMADAVELVVSEGTLITAELQVAVYHATAFATPSPSNFATVAMQATFLT